MEVGYTSAIVIDLTHVRIPNEHRSDRALPFFFQVMRDQELPGQMGHMLESIFKVNLLIVLQYFVTASLVPFRAGLNGAISFPNFQI